MVAHQRAAEFFAAAHVADRRHFRGCGQRGLPRSAPGWVVCPSAASWSCKQHRRWGHGAAGMRISLITWPSICAAIAELTEEMSTARRLADFWRVPDAAGGGHLDGRDQLMAHSSVRRLALVKCLDRHGALAHLVASTSVAFKASSAIARRRWRGRGYVAGQGRGHCGSGRGHARCRGSQQRQLCFDRPSLSTIGQCALADHHRAPSSRIYRNPE